MTDGAAAPTSAYALALSEAELQRYRAMADAARASEADLWGLAGIGAGARVADVGCGPGAMLPALAEAVGDDGSVVAVDGDPGAVAAATALVEAAGLRNVSVRTGRAEATGLDPNSLDVVMMRHVLAHNGGHEQAIVDHLAGLLRPGGCVFLVDVDGPATRIRPADPDLEDMTEKYWRFQAARGNDILVGLRLAQLVTAAGLEVLEYRGRYTIMSPPPGLRPPAWAARDAMVGAGIATPDDVARWDAALDGTAAVHPTIFVPMFTAVGRRAG